MQLKGFTDLALRVLLYVGKGDGELSTIGEIADYYRISKDHLRKVVHRLALGGFLTTVRGVNGGMSLARPPESINIGEVIRWMEEDFSIIDCDGSGCTLSGHCALKAALMKAQRAFLAALDEYHLGDFLKDKRLRSRFKELDVVFQNADDN